MLKISPPFKDYLKSPQFIPPLSIINHFYIIYPAAWQNLQPGFSAGSNKRVVVE